MSRTSQVTDAREREQVTAPNSNWILRAPAGSGKTTLLVTRYLKLLGLVEKPEEILAITFTRKATAEMRERILTSLKAPDSAQPNSLAEAALQARRASDAKGWEVIANPSRLKIQTIESFRRSLVEASPIEARIAPGTHLLPDARHLYEEAVERVFTRVRQGQSHTAPVVRMLALEAFKESRVKRQIIELLARRDQWRPTQTPTLKTQTPTLKTQTPTLDQSPDWLRSNMQRLWHSIEGAIDASDFAALAGRSPTLHTNDVLAQPGTWRRVANLCLTKQGELRKQLPAALDDQQRVSLRTLIDSLKDKDLTALRTARVFPDIKTDTSEQARIRAVEACLALAQDELRTLFAERGSADLVELGFGATRSLGTEELPTDLIIALDYSIKHVLIDEFQDTSVTQAEFIHSLMREWMPDEDRSVFAVGDPMQSIYGFREAEVGLFYLAEQQGVGRLIDQGKRSTPLRAAKLESNFRSDALLVDWVNQVFARASERGPDLTTGAVGYAPAVAIKRSERTASDLGASIHLFQGPRDTSLNLDHESQFIAKTARRLLRSEPHDQVAILLRNRTHARSLLGALRDQGIDYQGTELDRLADEGAVRDMLALARAVAKPRERLANFALLRSPAIGLSLASLHRLSAGLRHGASLDAVLTSERFQSALDAHERSALARCLPLLQDLRTRYQSSAPRPLLERAWPMIGLAAAHNDRRSRKSIEALLALIEAQGLTWIDFDALERALADLYAPSLSDSQLIVMTIHQAKGLEFDHVIVPFTARPPRSDERPSMRWRQTPEGLLAATKHGSGQDGSLYDWLEHEHKARAVAETERVLYVAVTRARKSLLLTATLPNGAIEQHEGKARLTDAASPRSGTLLMPIWNAVRTQSTLHLAREPETAQQTGPNEPPKLLRLPPDWTWRPKHRLAKIELDDAFRLAANEHGDTEGQSRVDSWTPRPPIIVGNAVHEALCWLAEHHLDTSPQDRIDEIKPLLRRLLMQDSCDASVATRLLPQVVRHLVRALRHKDCQWILTQRESAQSEASFSAYLNGRLVNIRIDRTFVENGTRYIIDFKTARPRAKESRAMFRARQIAEHEGQLTRYARVFNEIEQLPVVAALFLTSTPELLRVPLSSTP
ncbi:MAG: UvrD-helicase domain-containing protein [Gammaproteobacteria bacterium]|nr:UvrD-helicase domain-containing protein [Gammaproteobacteria bacterium]